MRDGNRHAGARNRQQLFGKLPLLARQKPVKREFARVKPADGKRARHRRRPRHRQHLDPRRRGLLRQKAAGVADAGRARVGDQRHIQILLQHARDDRRGAVFLVVLVVGDAGRVDFKMVEQRAGHARILGGDQIAVPQRLQRTRADIGEIANRRGDNKRRGMLHSSDSLYRSTRTPASLKISRAKSSG